MSWWGTRWQAARLVLQLVATAPNLHAQTVTDEVVVTGDAVTTEAFDILAAALARDGIALRREPHAHDCETVSDDPAARARVWLTWEEGTPAHLCFQDRCRSHERLLGPFAKLDARAREELITVIESGFDALRLGCRAEAPLPAAEVSTGAGFQPPHRAARMPAKPPSPAQSAVPPARASAAPEAAGTTPVAARAESALVRAASASAGTTPSAGAVPAAQAGASPARRAVPDAPRGPTAPLGAAARDLTPTDSPPSAATSAATDPHERAAGFALGASYGFTRWADAVFAQQLTAMVGYAVHKSPLYLGVELGYGPRFRALRDSLAIDVSCVRLAIVLWARVPLSKRWSINAQLGPAIEWLSLRPESNTARLLTAARSTDHAQPVLFGRLGPALRVYAAIQLGVELQLDGSWIAGSFGYLSDAGPRRVFEPDPVRLSLALHARAEL